MRGESATILGLAAPFSACALLSRSFAHERIAAEHFSASYQYISLLLWRVFDSTQHKTHHQTWMKAI